MGTIYLDTETTGMSPQNGDAIVEVAIVDDFGNTLVNTLVNPGRPIPFGATNVHSITDAMVGKAPKLVDLLATIDKIIKGSGHVVIYNSTFDMPFFPASVWHGVRVDCAMRQFAKLQREGGGNGRWIKLDRAAAVCGHVWSGAKHRALADALAARTVWHWCRTRS